MGDSHPVIFVPLKTLSKTHYLLDSPSVTSRVMWYGKAFPKSSAVSLQVSSPAPGSTFQLVPRLEGTHPLILFLLPHPQCIVLDTGMHALSCQLWSSIHMKPRFPKKMLQLGSVGEESQFPVSISTQFISGLNLNINTLEGCGTGLKTPWWHGWSNQSHFFSGWTEVCDLQAALMP